MINFEPKQEPQSFYDDDEDDFEKLTIGDSIQLNLGDNLDLEPKSESIDLGVQHIGGNDEIDLGVEEIKL